MAVEHALIQKDVLDQKISPKTYNDLLWKDKSVPGKLGSLFGLMLSGMGSGLTGQPNMLMEMMNRTIENDLNAQKSTKEGNRNLYQLNLQHQMNLAQQQKDYYDSYLANETAKLKPAERKLLLAQASQANATRDKTAAETAGVVTKNQMLEWVKNHFTGMTTNMSGPNQQNGQNILNNYIKPGFDQQIQGNITNGAGKTGLMQQMTPYPVIPGGGPVMGGQDNGQESNELPPDQPVANNELLNALSMEGSPFPKDTVAKSRDQAAEVQNIRDVKKMYYKAYDALNTPEAGQMGEAASRGIKTLGGLATKVLEAGMTLANPKTAILNALGSQASDKALSGAAEDVLKFQQFRKAQMGTVLPMMSRLTTGQFQSGESQYQEDSLFPTIYDMGDEDTRKAKFNNGMSLLDAEERKHSGVLDSIPGARISNSPVYKYPAMHADKKKKEEPTPPGLTPLDMSQQPLD
jgi:hypothetical protein